MNRSIDACGPAAIAAFIGVPVENVMEHCELDETGGMSDAAIMHALTGLGVGFEEMPAHSSVLWRVWEEFNLWPYQSDDRPADHFIFFVRRHWPTRPDTYHVLAWTPATGGVNGAYLEAEVFRVLRRSP